MLLKMVLFREIQGYLDKQRAITMSVTNKIIWILGILCAFLFILITGRTNIRNFEKVQSSIEEIYEDRLVVKGLIFDLSTLIQRKEVAFLKKDEKFFELTNETVNAQIEEQLRAFRATKLTLYEEKTLAHFTKGVEKLLSIEEEAQLSKGFKNIDSSQNFFDQIDSLQEDLKTLSHIQLSEGRRKLILSDQAVDSMYTFARAENYMLIFCGILMLIVIFIVPGIKKDRTNETQP